MSNMRHVILSAFAGIGLGLFAGGKFIGRQYEKHCELIEKQADRFSETSALMQQWVKVYQSGHNLQDYFKKNNYRKIAVYGMSEIGYMILKERFCIVLTKMRIICLQRLMYEDRTRSCSLLTQ